MSMAAARRPSDDVPEGDMFRAPVADQHRDQPGAVEIAEAEQRKPRDFRFRITKVTGTFESSIQNPFIRFEIGGIVSPFETQDLTTKKVKVKRKDEESGGMVDDVKEERVFKVAENLIGKRYVHYTACMQNVKQKVETSFPCDFGNEWHGVYADLKSQQIRIEVWNRRVWGGNDLIGKYKGVLVDIANGIVDQTVEIESPGTPKETVATVRFKCEFQEIFDFTIDVRDWEIQRRVPVAVDLSGKLKPHRTFKRTPVLKFSAPRAPFRDKLQLAARKVASLLYYHPFNGHIPALATPLSFWLPYRELPLLAEISKSWENTKTVCFISALNKDAPPNGKVQEESGCLSVTEPQPVPKAMLSTSALHYNGTRTDLENEYLQVDLNEENCGHKPLRGRCALQGILDYGYLSVQLSNGRDEFAAAGEITFRPPGPMYRQAGNLEYASADAVNMVVTVARARQLESLVGYQEYLNPSVTVEWNNQQKQTRTVTATSEPYWNEQCWFRTDIDKDNGTPLPTELFKTSLSVQCWDNESFSRSPLGYAEIDFLTVFRERKIAAGKGNRLVFKKALELNISDDYGKINVSPTLEIEVHFVPELKMSRLEFTDFNKLRAEAQAVAEAKVLADEEYNRALTAWAELQKKIESSKIPAGDGFAMNCPPKRYFHVQGIDEQTGSVFWLPRFLGELHPPAGLLSDEDLLHFVSSLEFQHRSCGKSSKKDNMKPPMLTWSDPFYFLDKRKGTVRDHAILLCNFLLARMHDAYVCIGSIRQPNHELTEHVWVMTRELEKSKIDESLPPKSTIKFWETTTGTVYTLDSGKVLRFNERKNDDGKWVLPVARPEIILDPKKAAQQIEGAGERSSDLPPGSPRRKSQRHVDLKKNEQGFGSDLLGIGIAEPSPTSSSVCAEAFSVLTELEEARKRFEVEKINEQTERLAPLRIPEFEGHPTLPYVCLDVVFNNVRLYANVQSANPQLITYNFNTEHDRWFEFPFHITTTKEAVVGPFYNKKPLRPKASSYEVKQATFDIARTVEVACSQFREFSGDPDAAETRFFTAGALPTLDYRMDIEEKYTYDRRASMRPISDEPPHTAQRTSKLSDWHDALQRQLPPGFRYTEKVLAFKHADGSRIADTVVRHCKEDILQIRDAKLPQFAIRVKIEEMPCSVCPVRVLLAAVYKAGPDDDPDWKLQANLRAKQ